MPSVPCPACGTPLAIDPRGLGRVVRCAKCTTKFRTPPPAPRPAGTPVPPTTFSRERTAHRSVVLVPGVDRRPGGTSFGARLLLVAVVIAVVAGGLLLLMALG
jgi:hypothetical protein